MNLKEKILPFIPMPPGFKYSFYCGSNSLKDIFILIKYLIFKNKKKSMTEKFEKLFSRKSKNKYAVSFGSGRMALYSILKTLPVKKGDEIILPAFTCSVVPNAIIYTGAIPVYVDISCKDFNLDVDLLEKKISKKTVAIYAQHTFGVRCKMSKINKLAKKYNLKVIEEKAHYFPKKKSKDKTYASFFSLDHSKVINTYMGGVASTNNHLIYKKLKKIQRNSFELGSISKIRISLSFILEIIFFNRFLFWIGKSLYSLLFYLGIIFYFRDNLVMKKPKYYPSKFPEILSCVAIDQIKNIKNNLNYRNKIAQMLEKEINWYKFLQKDMKVNTWLRYSFLVKDQKKFIDKFKNKLDLEIWYSSIFEGRTKNFKEIKYKKGSCPEAEYCSRHIINFPTHKNIPISLISNILSQNNDWIKTQINFKRKFSK